MIALGACWGVFKVLVAIQLIESKPLKPWYVWEMRAYFHRKKKKTIKQQTIFSSCAIIYEAILFSMKFTILFPHPTVHANVNYTGAKGKNDKNKIYDPFCSFFLLFFHVLVPSHCRSKEFILYIFHPPFVKWFFISSYTREKKRRSIKTISFLRYMIHDICLYLNYYWHFSFSTHSPWVVVCVKQFKISIFFVVHKIRLGIGTSISFQAAISLSLTSIERWQCVNK
jgi:hypothetical protein